MAHICIGRICTVLLYPDLFVMPIVEWIYNSMYVLCFQVQWLFNNEPVVSPDYQISDAGDVYTLYIPEVTILITVYNTCCTVYNTC